MIEKFTDEELTIIRKELAEKDKSEQPKPKPYDIYHPEVLKLFQDRPFPVQTSHRSGDVADHVLEYIDRISSYTLDCVQIKDKAERGCQSGIIYHHFSARMLPRIPADTYKEYCDLWEDIINVIKKHIKPYNRFHNEEADAVN